MWQICHGQLSAGAVVLETVGSVLGQGLYGQISTRRSNHILIGCWLFFGVILGTAYRSSLIASLTLPSLPPRPETVEELVTAVERITYESHGSHYKTFFRKSKSPIFRALGELIYVGVDVTDGLRDALQMKQAVLNTRQYLQLMIARHFTQKGGYSPIYIGRGQVITYSLAWPIPHDAPYEHALGNVIVGVVEAGLYDQWQKETLEKVSRENREKQQKYANTRGEQHGGLTVIEDTNSKSLTITHILGPLLLLLLGLSLAGVSFVGEKYIVLPAASLRIKIRAALLRQYVWPKLI